VVGNDILYDPKVIPSRYEQQQQQQQQQHPTRQSLQLTMQDLLLVCEQHPAYGTCHKSWLLSSTALLRSRAVPSCCTVPVVLQHAASPTAAQELQQEQVFVAVSS